MTDQQFENKVRLDTANVKKDIGNLVEDGTAQINRLQDKVSQAPAKAKQELADWVEENVAELSDNFERLAGDAKDTVVSAAATVKEDVGRGLGQYNAKVQGYADKVPGGFAEKASIYPWVAISIALLVGFMLGNLLKPTRTVRPCC
jgi:ElaB/YqjD/DUF883 family membrane-anchored ribosome-binding protein